MSEATHTDSNNYDNIPAPFVQQGAAESSVLPNFTAVDKFLEMCTMLDAIKRW